MFRQKRCKNYTMNIAVTKLLYIYCFSDSLLLLSGFLFLLGSSIFLHIVQRVKTIDLG